MKNQTSREAYLERLRGLADINKKSIKETKNRTLGNLIDYKRAADGVAYGIIKENHNYYIKKAGIKSDPDVSDFAYIGGLANITNFQYKSLSEADKNRNMIMHTINEAGSLKQNKTGSKKRLNEDIAGQEIDNAENKLSDLDAATAAEDQTNSAEFAAGNEAEPAQADGTEMPAGDGGEGMPAPDGGEGMPAPDSEEGMPAPDGGEGMPAGDGSEEGMPAGDGSEEMSAAGEGEDESIRELEKGIGKITNTIRKTDLEPSQTQSYLKSFIQAFKDKLPELEIEERKDIANLILKIVPPEDIEDLGQNVEDHEEGQGVEEAQCSECGTFARYAESRGYNSAESLMECGEEEVGNVISGYANAHNDGMNDGDLEGVALVIKVINPELLNTLKNDYGHEEYAEKLQPQVDSMNESTDEENIAKLNELFGGLKSLGKAAMGGLKAGANAIGSGISNAGQAVGSAVAGGAQRVGQAGANAANAVGSGISKAGQAVSGGIKAGVNAVGDAAQGIQQTYHQGEVGGEVKKLEKMASDLGAQVAALNARLVKAGQEPVNVQGILRGITNQLTAGKGASLAGTKAGSQIQRENIDPANVETQTMLKEDGDEDDEKQDDIENIESMENVENTDGMKNTEEFNDDIKFAPAGQSLGAGVVKPIGAPTTGIDVNVDGQNKMINIKLAEAKKQLGSLTNMINEISTGLANNASWKGLDKYNANSGPNNHNDPVTAQIGQSQSTTFGRYINPEMKQYLENQGFTNIRKNGDSIAFDVAANNTNGIATISVDRNSYNIVDGGIHEINGFALRKLKDALPKIKADLNMNRDDRQPTPNELEENLNESEQKLRRYVRGRLEEKAGLKKPSINENKKSDAFKKLDSMIDERFKVYESLAKKKK